MPQVLRLNTKQSPSGACAEAPAFIGAPLSVDGFVAGLMTCDPRALDLEMMGELISRLDPRDPLIQNTVRFADGSYTRNLVCRTPRFDLLVLCWRPGQHTSIHDHAGSRNVTRVLRGVCTAREFQLARGVTRHGATVRMLDEERLEAGRRTAVERGSIHQLANGADEELITVHLYARPLDAINTYSPVDGSVRRLSIRYSLESESD